MNWDDKARRILSPTEKRGMNKRYFSIPDAHEKRRGSPVRRLSGTAIRCLGQKGKQLRRLRLTPSLSEAETMGRKRQSPLLSESPS